MYAYIMMINENDWSFYYPCSCTLIWSRNNIYIFKLYPNILKLTSKALHVQFNNSMYTMSTVWFQLSWQGLSWSYMIYSLGFFFLFKLYQGFSFPVLCIISPTCVFCQLFMACPSWASLYQYHCCHSSSHVQITSIWPLYLHLQNLQPLPSRVGPPPCKKRIS